MKDISKQIVSQIDNADTVRIYFVNPQYNEENSYKEAKLNINDSVIETAKEIISTCMQGFSEKEAIAIEKLDKQDEDYVVTVTLLTFWKS
ncbi:hypothetical protein [Sediminibacillus albus]|uniref:Uncharacterized protein n=1 Tax=Sediminibacillus albus TaxID=407036 RepID=A0A1G9A429_9BACI|nr:hypothetical protein [Sediminibacillus albus]SDK22007.1 hypothetical protein SAMN05216243_2398 [Sediminibacillus albus]